MNIVRVGAINPPDTNRSRWAREHLSAAVDLKLSPLLLPVQHVVSFTVPLPPHVAAHIKELAAQSNLSAAATAAGLIESHIRHQRQDEVGSGSGSASASDLQAIAGAERVRPILQSLLTRANEGITKGKIVFAEAATGTGKGRMIAALAGTAAARGDTVVISAPLAVVWQLLDDLAEIKEAVTAGCDLVLGRANFVSPAALAAWAEDEGHTQMLHWIAEGGQPLSERARRASQMTGKPFRWLLDDALSIADNLPITSVMLTTESEEDCEGEQTYQKLRSNDGAAAIILCSHHMLASHIRQAQIRRVTVADEQNANGLVLPLVIDTLIVDEAHLLENAFAAINSHALHLRPLIRAVERDIRFGRTPLLAALKELGRHITEVVGSDEGRGLYTLAEQPELERLLKELDIAIAGALTKAQTKLPAGVLLSVARNGIRAALSGAMNLRFEVSPVRKYPQLAIGRANLAKAMDYMWDHVIGAALVSATLYSDDNSAKLIRWKLGVPPARALYLPAVHPGWVAEAVQLSDLRVNIVPDDGEAWLNELAAATARISGKAAGGTLVLCTSHNNAQALAQRLAPTLENRLVLQTASNSASICASEYKALYRQGIKPVWIGLGAAWTGIDLSDVENPAEDDWMLSDLIITRLPLGINRSLTHERRVSLAGFSIVAQEAAWQLRQGLGRLVRREGFLNEICGCSMPVWMREHLG